MRKPVGPFGLIAMLLAWAGVFFLVLVSSLSAETPLTTRTLVLNRDVTATSYEYCVLSEPLPGESRLVTAGSSTTTTAVGGVSVFGALVAQDELTATPSAGGAPLVRYVATPGTTSIVVNSAWDLTASHSWTYRTYAGACGATANDGWVPVAGRTTAYITVTDLNATNIGYSVEIRSSPSGPSQYTPGTITSEAIFLNTAKVEISSVAAEVRIGLQVNTDTGLQAVTAVLVSDPRFGP